MGLNKFRQNRKAAKSLLQPAAEKMKSTGKNATGLYPQKQPGLNYVGLHVPIGRLYAEDMFDLARMAEVYGSSEIRLTVEAKPDHPQYP